MSKGKVFLNTIFILMYDFQYLGSTGPSGGQGALRKKLLKKI